MILGIRAYITGALIAGTLIGSFLLVQRWHYTPIATLKAQVVNIQITVNTLESDLAICEANLSKQALQGYIDGIEREGVVEDDESIIIDFSNIVY